MARSIISLTALALAAALGLGAGPAAAQDGERAEIAQQIEERGLGPVDVSTLSDEQVSKIEEILASDAADGFKTQRIELVLDEG